MCAGLRTELLRGHTVIVYDDEVPPPAEEDEEDDVPSLQSRDSSDEEDEEEDMALPFQNKKKQRLSYTIKKKKALLQIIDSHIASLNLSKKKACAKEGIAPSMYRRWKKLFVDELDINKRKGLSSARQVGGGRHGLLKAHTEALLRYIFELREQGYGVQTAMVVRKACKLSREFAQKSPEAQRCVIRRWLHAQSLRFRMGTHECQRSPSETHAEALDFITNVARVKCSQANRHPRWILNMDQTPIFFTNHFKMTIEKKGAKAVNVLTSTGDTKRATFAPTICGDGSFLLPMLIFKGERHGRIATKEFPSYPPVCLFACQKNAWMDEEAMIQWVDEILAPHIELCPPGIVPLLALDSYRCHMMASVVHRIQNLGVEVEHIPGGCTSLCQPLDVGLNKPLKSYIKTEWNDWMLDEGVEDGKAVCPPPMNWSSNVRSIHGGG